MKVCMRHEDNNECFVIHEAKICPLCDSEKEIERLERETERLREGNR
jgi:hypothetical protein